MSISPPRSVSPKTSINQGSVASDTFLTVLPDGFMTYEEYKEKFSLESSSTEKPSPITAKLSQVMHENNLHAGLELLLQVDESVIDGIKKFIPSLERYAPLLADKMRKGGTIYLVGSGSSGRVGLDIAAKCKSAFGAGVNVVGVLSGGDSAMIRPRENYEDSFPSGKKALESYSLSQNDAVFLVSASGSATFNEGCGQYAAASGASVFYFYNSEKIPVRTQELFSKHAVVPLCVDIGGQAIAGSTRLQAATLAEACLGGLLASAAYQYLGDVSAAESYPKKLVENMTKVLELLRNQLKDLAIFPKIQQRILSSPNANLRQLTDQYNQGYITFLAAKDCMRVVLIDATETSPTFSTNPMRRENEQDKKRPEFCAYLLGESDNQTAWNALLNREVVKSDVEDTDAFILAQKAQGNNSYKNRPIGKGNFVIGVAKIGDNRMLSYELEEAMLSAQRQGGDVGLILLYDGTVAEEAKRALRKSYGAVLMIENVPQDVLGLSETILLKQALNLISNSSMVLMDKVYGNLMIDVRASNKKLIGRCVNLVHAIWNSSQPRQLSDKVVYHYVAHVLVAMEKVKAEGNYVPSVVKIVLEMLARDETPADFEKTVSSLRANNECLQICK